ncbi:MAG: RNA methyltransferase [Planctomycetes bacterium]|nr:RNA methyltransferase [Planctomycetota bacterium]
MALTHCRVVLVEPMYPGNIGATARCMRNFGLDDLALVSPQADPLDREACRMATHGEDILRRARVVDDLGAAVADCVVVAGTSAKSGGLFRRQSVGAPDEMMPFLVEALRADRPAALVFGTEPKGLTNESISRCRFLVRIPVDDGYPALNLAQAVAVCLYGLRVEWLKTGDRPAQEPKEHETPADFAAQEQMFGQLRTALEEIHFLYGDKAEPLMHALRHLIGKANPSVMEVKLLQGLARQIQWYVREHTAAENKLDSAAGGSS